MKRLLESLKKLKSKKGATAVEYAVMVSLIAAVIIGAVLTIGNKINSAFWYVANILPSW